MPKTLACLDIETTGLSPDRDKIIEIGVAIFDFKERKIIKEFSTFINPGVAIPSQVTNLTGITDADVKTAPKIADIKTELEEFIRDYPIVGHNINFDIEFLNANGFEIKNLRLDSIDIAHIAFPKTDSYSLEIIGKILDVEERGKHRALSDVKSNIEILYKLFDLYFSKTPDIKNILEKSASPWKEVIKIASENCKTFKLNQKKSVAKSQKKVSFEEDKLLAEIADLVPENFIEENPENKTIICAPEIENGIHEPANYLEQKLFEKFLQKETFTPEETVFALKIIPLIGDREIARNELTLPQNGKDLWWDFACASLPENIIKKLTTDKTILISHRTLAKIALQMPELIEGSTLIILDADELFEHTRESLTVRYSMKRLGESDTVTMLFAHLGIMAEKYGEGFEFKLEEHHFDTPEWQKVATLIEKLPQEDRVVKFLNKSKKYSENLNLSIRIFEDGTPLLTITPLNIGAFLEEKYWSKAKRIQLFSSTLTFAEESPKYDFIKSSLNLPLDIKITPSDEKKIYIEKTSSDLEKLMEKEEKPIYVLTGSQRACEQIHAESALNLKNAGIKLLAQNSSGGIGKIKSMLKETPGKTVVVGTYDFYKQAKPEIKTLIIFRIPFPHPNAVQIKCPEAEKFKKYALPATMIKLKKIGLNGRMPEYL